MYRARKSLSSEEYDRYRTNQEPDLEAKVFMQLGQKLSTLSDMMQKFFGEPRFSLDRRRASYAYLDTHIKRIRQKLAIPKDSPWDIETVWGVGYKFELKNMPVESDKA